MVVRCAWGEDPINQAYHDHEWGRPQFEPRALFEALTLELMQSGLSWKTIMNKRDNFKLAFSNWDYNQVAQYDEAKVDALVQDASIIRHRKKIEAVINNAQCMVEMEATTIDFSAYIWQVVAGMPIVNHWQHSDEVPATTPLATELSRDLKRRGFKFVGPTTTYAFLQAIGVINDHLESCDFKYN
ncbi:DNA-3-methyladenine glycosylase I [Weissella viridescens]|uniref:DNA-3-methyladenine glycosylase I n=1 Tax=Weissella viridescens TaxID=1629 RepID=A0A3P2RIK4_WEIVI|nr:DNA-3-methyladenine glycosylase I [Weissella viridescens]RRG17552.1 DNA-3-methyladenine glycosylase I [Weissella viridescens]